MVPIEDRPIGWATHSLCWNVWQQGWVAAQDYEDDVDFSLKWPESLRKVYYTLVEGMVKKAYSTYWGKYLFFGTAYLYIQSVNGIGAMLEGRREMWKSIATPLFLIWVFVAFIAAVGLYVTRKSK